MLDANSQMDAYDAYMMVVFGTSTYLCLKPYS